MINNSTNSCLANTDILLDVTDLNMHFGGIKALKNVNLQILSNNITAIIGPNGAGKTTLFNCITGFYTPTSGNIYLYQQNHNIRLNTLLGENLKYIDFLNFHKLTTNLQKIYYKWFGGAHLLSRIGIARTFQNIRLFSKMTVLENLLVAQHFYLNKNIISGLINSKSYQNSEQQALSVACKWLEICGLKTYANDLAGSLPYGHQRLLEIARAMCTQPKLLCLDEPAAGLNHQETDDLCKLIKKICVDFKTTILLIEHDMNLIMSISEKIYVLDHGVIIASGTPQEIRNNPQVITAYLGT